MHVGTPDLKWNSALLSPNCLPVTFPWLHRRKKNNFLTQYENIYSYKVRTHSNKYMYTLFIYPYEHLRKIMSVYLDINEVIHISTWERLSQHD